MTFHREEGGVTAIWLALVFVFFLGAAALAVDASGAFNTARTDQNTADLACLAGVKELPGSPTDAINTTVAYVEANWPEMTSQSLTVTGTTAIYTDGAGNVVNIDAAYDGDPSKMSVDITEVRPSFFGRAIGQDTITVSQEAWCRVIAQGVGGGNLPFGATPGGFDGNLQDFNPCPAGNCGPIDIPRDYPNGGGPQFEENLASGSDRFLEAWLGPVGGAVVCSSVGAGDTCHIFTTNTGVSSGQLGAGIEKRFQQTSGSTCTFVSNGVTMDCDTPAQILGSAPASLMSVFPSQPGFWDTSLHGDYTAANTANHVYYDGVIEKCSSPRIGWIPIITDDLDWDLGDGPTVLLGNETVKVIGFLWVIVIDPNDAGDFFGSNNLKNASSVVVWFGPNVACRTANGGTIPFDPSNPNLVSKTVALVNETG